MPDREEYTDGVDKPIRDTRRLPLEEQEVEVKLLLSAVEELAGVLSPVLVPMPKLDKAENGEDRRVMSPSGEKIDRNNMNIAFARSKIQEIMKNVEV